MDIRCFMENKRKLIIGVITLCFIIFFFFLFKGNGDNKVVVLKKEVEAGRLVDVSSLVKVSDEYKNTYTIRPFKRKMNFTETGKKEVIYILRKKGTNDKEEIRVSFDIIDTTPPEIKNTKALIVPLGSDFNIAELVEAYDIVDGRISTDKIKVEGSIDTSEIGKYKVSVKVSDNKGNATEKDMDVSVVKAYAAAESIRNIEGKYVNKEKEIILSFYNNYGRAAYSIGKSGDKNSIGGYVVNIYEDNGYIDLTLSYDTSNWQKGEKPNFEFANMKLYKNGNNIRLKSFIDYKNIDFSYAGKRWEEVIKIYK